MDRIANAGIRRNCSTPRRCARRRARHCSRGATTTLAPPASSWRSGTGYPGYNTLIPKSKRGLGEILKQNGYNTAWYGKNHNVPDWHQPGRAVRPVAHRAGLRVLLRLHRRRHQPVGAGDLSRTRRRSNRRTTIKTTTSTRTWPTRPSHGSACCTRSRPTSRSSPTTRRARPRPAPRPEGVDRQVQGQVRQGWDKQRELT